jgi:hypothetical protein
MKKAVKKLLVPVVARALARAMSAAAMAAWVNTTIPFLSQEQSHRCWAASSVMMIRAQGITRSQTVHVAQAIYGVNTTNLSSAPNVTRTATAVKNDFNMLYGISAVSTGTLTMSTIRSKIYANKPILAGVVWASNAGGHMMVIAWCDDTNDNLKIYDPYYGHDTYARSDFLSAYRGQGNTWAVSIYWN